MYDVTATPFVRSNRISVRVIFTSILTNWCFIEYIVFLYMYQCYYVFWGELVELLYISN